jgi:hypothetical protein
MGNWKTIAVTGLALLGAYYLVQRYRGPGGVFGSAGAGGGTKRVDPVALDRFTMGAKAQAEAAKAAALGGAKPLADANASEAVKKS